MKEIKPDEQDSLILNSTLTLRKTIREIRTKTYVNFMFEKNRISWDSFTVFNQPDHSIDKNEFKKLESIKVIRDPTTENEVWNKIILMKN